MDSKRCRRAAEGLDDEIDQGEVQIVEKQDWLRLFVQLGLFARVWPEERVLLALRVCTWMQKETLTLVDTVRVIAIPKANVNAVQVGWTLMNLRKHYVALVCQSPLITTCLLDGLTGAATMGFGSRLVELNFSRANLQLFGARTAAKSIRGQCTALTHLDLQANHIGDAGLQAWAAVLAENTKLHHLVLSENGVSAVGLRSVAAEMRGPRLLRHLDVSRNNLGDEGTVSVASLLSSSTAHLTSLNLSSTKLADTTAALGDALGKCTALRHLDLGQNTLRGWGMQRLAAGLRFCQCLEFLELGPNALGPAGGTQLAEVTRHTYDATFGFHLSAFRGVPPDAPCMPP